jgi:hypothetical protein
VLSVVGELPAVVTAAVDRASGVLPDPSVVQDLKPGHFVTSINCWSSDPSPTRAFLSDSIWSELSGISAQDNSQPIEKIGPKTYNRDLHPPPR